MIELLRDPGDTAVLQAATLAAYFDGNDRRTRRLARWWAATSGYADLAAEFVEKAAFRLRREGALEAERDRLDALAADGRYAADPATDRRLRDLRARLARLAALTAALEADEPDDGPAAERRLQMLCGPHGWRHNMPLQDGRWTFDLGHVKQNSPVTGGDHNVFQMALLRPHLPDFAGRTVIDAGPADGYFGLTAAREGADVIMVEPDPLFCLRIRHFARHYGVDGRVRLANGFLMGRHIELLRRADICLALGLLYHMWPLEWSLDLLLATGGHLVLEYVFEDRDLVTPDEAESGWRSGTPIPDRWLMRRLAERGWLVSSLPEWEAKVAQARPDGPRRKMIVCRRAAVA